MQSFGRHEDLGIADRVTFVTECKWQGHLYDLGRFPGAVPGDETVHGELFRLADPQVWTVLDRYEGYEPNRGDASLFVRSRVSLQAPNDQTSWIYWYNGDPSDHDRVPSGDWATYVQNQKRS